MEPQRASTWSGCSVRIRLWPRPPHGCHHLLSMMPQRGGLNRSGVDPPLSSSRACLTTFIAIAITEGGGGGVALEGSCGLHPGHLGTTTVLPRVVRKKTLLGFAGDLGGHEWL